MLMILQTPLFSFPGPFCLVEETNDLSCNVLASGLLVIHDASRGCEDDITELTGWQELDNPLLEIGETDVVSGGDDTSLVEAAVQLNDNLAGTVVIDFLEFTNIAMLLHNREELDDNLGRRADQDLSLSRLLGVVDGIERIVEDGSLNHFGGERFSNRVFGNEVSIKKSGVSLHRLGAWRVPS
jgi:hypothetical protein